jgi:hypothetical protein
VFVFRHFVSESPSLLFGDLRVRAAISRAALQTARSPGSTERTVIQTCITSAGEGGTTALIRCYGNCHLSTLKRNESQTQMVNHHTELYRCKYFKCQAHFLVTLNMLISFRIKAKKTLRGLSPRANYTDRAIAACRRS